MIWWRINNISTPLPTISSSPAFDWREYIVLRVDNSEHIATLESILDKISKTPDGQALIKKAFEVSGSGKHKVEIATSSRNFTLGGKPLEKHDWGTIGAADIFGQPGNYEGKLTIDLDGFGKIAYIAPNGSVVLASRTNVLVHEMFHLADPHLRPDIRDAEYKDALREELGKILDVPNARIEIKTQVIDAAVENIFRDFGLTSKLDIQQLFSPERLALLQQIAGEFQITVSEPQEVLFLKLRGSIRGNDSYPVAAQTGVSVHPSPEGGAPRHEEQCIKWVDIFMEKYFGERPRQGYGNKVKLLEQTPTPIAEPELLATPTPDDRHLEYIPDIFFSPSVIESIKDLPAPLDFVEKATAVDAAQEAASGTFGPQKRFWSHTPGSFSSHQTRGIRLR